MTTTELLQFGQRHFGPGMYLVLAVIAAELFNLLTFRKLNSLGIVPRDSTALAGILLAPLLHENLRHFFANLVPLCILGFLLGQLLPGTFWGIIAIIWLGSGLLVWLLARRFNHIGASGLIYGLVGYITLHGFLSGNIMHMVVSIVLVLLYSGIVWGVLPTAGRRSWESHLAGLAIGLGLAWTKLF